MIDLVGINYASGSFTENYSSATGVLTVSHGTNGASLTFDAFNGAFTFASDNNGGTDIFDPPNPSGQGVNNLLWEPTTPEASRGDLSATAYVPGGETGATNGVLGNTWLDSDPSALTWQPTNSSALRVITAAGSVENLSPFSPNPTMHLSG